MVQRRIRPPQPTISIYANLGLTDLPFPGTPVANPYSADPRVNGAIYAEEPVRPNIQKFERLLIRPEDFQNRVRLAYLWAMGDQESGRGMGKTALLRYFRQRINQDWGRTEYSDQFSALVVYVSFRSQVDRRHIEQLALSALVDICQSGVLPVTRADLRFDQMTEQQLEQVVINPDGSEDVDNLLDDAKLAAIGVDVAQLNQKVTMRLVDEGVENASAAALAEGRFEDYLKSFRRDNRLEPFYVPRDTKILNYSCGILFNDMVFYLRAAGFAGGYLFIDDIENLVDLMPRRHQVEFAKEFALCTVRPGYANTTHNFFSCVLATHQQASVRLSAAWGEAGLSGIARLDPSDPNSVELPLPSPDQAREILVAHLDYYRANPEQKGSIAPFTEDGMTALIKKTQHPRTLLSAAGNVVKQAAEAGRTSIDASVVNAASEGAPASAEQYHEGMEGST